MGLGIFAGIKNSDDAGMVQASGSLCFIEKSLAEFLVLLRFLPLQRDGLKCDQAIDLGIARLVDDTHGTAA